MGRCVVHRMLEKHTARQNSLQEHRRARISHDAFGQLFPTLAISPHSPKRRRLSVIRVCSICVSHKQNECASLGLQQRLFPSKLTLRIRIVNAQCICTVSIVVVHFGPTTVGLALGGIVSIENTCFIVLFVARRVVKIGRAHV